MNEDDLAALVAEHASRHSVPGAALGILRGEAKTATWYGVADVTTREPVRPETNFSVGSLTKPMVATVIVRLADAGKLSLDDPAAAHVPELSRSGWAQRATVRDLLANRSGLPLRAATEFGFTRHRDEDEGALSRLVAEAAEEASRVDFWSYSNLGWCLLGRVIEAVSGTTWEGAMRRLLFHPTGMSSTTFATGSDTKQRVSGHEIKAGNPVPVEPLAARAYGPAGTSVVSTVSDLLRFAALHLEDPSFVALRAAQDAVSIYGWFDAWCLGWARFDWQGGPVWGWDGLIGGERSVLRIVPQHQAAIVLLTNGSTGRAMYRSLLADVMRSLFGIDVPPLSLDPLSRAPGDLSGYSGTYAWPDRRIEVSATPSGLVIKEDRTETEALPLDERAFLVDRADPDTPTVTFGDFDASGRPGVLYDMLWGLPRVPE